jgi:hypothetical protein
MHTEDTLVAGRFIANYETKTPRKVHLVAVGKAGAAALHAAALEPTLFSTVTLRDAPADWSQVAARPVPAGELCNSVHGALRIYDLSDLQKTIGPDKLRVEPAK